MTTTLTVIALIRHIKSSDKTAYGEATYREKIANKNHHFSFKQFINARHAYNEPFHEGDLVLLGGKFTVDNKKLMVIILFLNSLFLCILI